MVIAFEDHEEVVDAVWLGSAAEGALCIELCRGVVTRIL